MIRPTNAGVARTAGVADVPPESGSTLAEAGATGWIGWKTVVRTGDARAQGARPHDGENAA
jgi:hypothetical protein